MGDYSPEQKTVLITGFGPFGNHIVNASWVAVEELEKYGLGEDVNLKVVEIPVVYEKVKGLIPDLWTTHKPDLTVHVGVSGIARELTLEQQAHNRGYDKFDVEGKCPSDNCCNGDHQEECLVSQLDMDKVCGAVNEAQCGVTAIVSHDPGRYLCDFIYYSSLSVNEKRTAFIHVPPLDKPYSSQQLAAAIRIAVQAMLQQLS